MCFHNQVLEVRNSTHIGISRMKRLARQFVWWPKLDSDVESVVKFVQSPDLNLHLQCYTLGNGLGSHGMDFMLIMPAHCMERCTSLLSMPILNGWMCTSLTAITIEKLQLLFSTFGLPHVLVSDNGPAFSSCKFQDFMKQNGINHV